MSEEQNDLRALSSRAHARRSFVFARGRQGVTRRRVDRDVSTRATRENVRGSPRGSAGVLAFSRPLHRYEEKKYAVSCAEEKRERKEEGRDISLNVIVRVDDVVQMGDATCTFDACRMHYTARSAMGNNRVLGDWRCGFVC